MARARVAALPLLAATAAAAGGGGAGGSVLFDARLAELGRRLAAPSGPPPAPAGDIVDFTQSVEVRAARWLIETLSPAGVGAAVDTVTHPPGCVDVADALLSIVIDKPIGTIDVGRIGVDVGNVTLCGLDGFTRLDVLNPAPPDPRHTLANDIAFGAGSPVVVSMDVRLRIDGMGAGISDAMRVGLSARGMGLNATVLARLRGDRLRALPLKERLLPRCLLSAVDRAPRSLRIPSLRVAAGEWRAAVDCGGGGSTCSSPMMPSLNKSLATAHAREILTKWINQELGKAATFVDTPMVQTLLSNIAANATCPPAPKPAPTPKPAPAPKNSSDDDGADLAFYFVLFTPMALTLAAMVYFAALGFNERMQQPAIAEKARATDELLGDEEPCTREWWWQESLSCSDVVSSWTRIWVPTVLILCYPMDLIANTTVGIEGNVEIGLLGNKLKLDDVFDQGLETSFTMMWNAGMQWTSIIIAFCEGSWPHMRISMLLFAWFMPPEVIGEKARGKLLKVLEFAGKWAILNVFIVIEMIVSFQLHVQTPDGVLPPGALVFDLHMVPLLGSYTNTSATIVSILANHVMLMRHRDATVAEKAAAEDARSHAEQKSPSRRSAASVGGTSVTWTEFGRADGRREALAMQIFRGGGGGGGGDGDAPPPRAAPSRAVAGTLREKALAAALLVVLTVSTGLVVTGIAVQTFAFEFTGLAGAVLANAKSDYSLISLVTGFYKQHVGAWGWNGGVGYLLQSIPFVLMTVVVPLIQLTALLLLFVLPLTLREQKLFVTLNSILAAWSALEVFIVSLLSGLFQMPQFAQTLVGDKCGSVNTLLAGPGVAIGLVKEGDAKCFGIKATLLPGCWYLFSGALGACFAFILLINWSERMVAARENVYTLQGRRERAAATADRSSPGDLAPAP